MPRTAASAYLPVHLRPKPTGKRVKAPADLGAEERAIFQEIVNSLPPDWFHDCNKRLLADYAVLVVIRKRFVEQMDAAAKAGDSLLQRALFKDIEAATKLTNQLLRSMRLAQLSVKHRETSKHVDVGASIGITDAAKKRP